MIDCKSSAPAVSRCSEIQNFGIDLRRIFSFLIKYSTKHNPSKQSETRASARAHTRAFLPKINRQTCVSHAQAQQTKNAQVPKASSKDTEDVTASGWRPKFSGVDPALGVFPLDKRAIITLQEHSSSHQCKVLKSTPFWRLSVYRVHCIAYSSFARAVVLWNFACRRISSFFAAAQLLALRASLMCGLLYALLNCYRFFFFCILQVYVFELDY